MINLHRFSLNITNLYNLYLNLFSTFPKMFETETFEQHNKQLRKKIKPITEKDKRPDMEQI